MSKINENVNGNIDELKKLAQVILEQQNSKLKEPMVDNNVSNDVDKIINLKTIGPQQSVSDVSQPNSQSIINIIPNGYNIMGLNVPVQTLYLIILLIIIGVVIWYTSRQKDSEVV